MFAVTFPALALLEISRAGDMSSPLAPIRWASYLVLAVWALWLLVRGEHSSMPLVLATTWFFGILAIIEALFDVEVSTFDFATTFGLVMMLGVFAGVLSTGSRLVWSGAIGATVAAWAVTMGLLLGDPVEVMAVRAVIAVAGVIFTTSLVSKLYEQLSEAISRYEKATRLQHAIATCSEALLVQTDQFAVYEALKALLEATDADYAYVDANVDLPTGMGWQIVADARRTTAMGVGDWRQGAYREDSTVYQALSQGRAISIHTRDLRGDERSAYERDGILSEVTVPINVGGTFRGSIGFVDYTFDRKWTEDEIDTLWRASHMIGAYWRRQDDQEQLKASNESKDRLLASVSHEIRTPLTAIVGLSEEIVSGRVGLPSDELEELHSIIATQSRELAELVEDLLVASRADTGSLSIRPDWVDLRAEVDAVVRVVRGSKVSGKAIAVVGDSVMAWADALRCRQVVRNLLTNAVKYGGNRIAVAVRHSSGYSQVIVADDGPGVSEEEEELIFERYYRSNESPTQPGSVGIGLAVSRQLAEMMGGHLHYVQGPGETRFEMLLPSHPPEPLTVEPLFPGIAEEASWA